MIDFRPNLLKTATRLDLARIQVAMLWPDDETARAKAWEASKAEHYVQAVERKDLPTPTATEFPGIARLLRGTPPIDDELTGGRHLQGAAVGTLLLWAVGWNNLNPKMGGLGRNKKDVAKYFGYSVSTIDNLYWPRFKPVVHLWASFMQQSSQNPGPPVHPCKLANLGEFLAVAEHYRKAGETIRPPNARGTILEPGTALAIPIELPAVEVTAERNSYI